MAHPALQLIVGALQGEGFEGRLFLVGGAVRDELLGRDNSGDFDIVVEGDAHQVASLLYEKGVCRQPPEIYARFGTALIIVKGIKIELATARTESYSSDSRKPDVQQASIEADAWRRDFTVNTLMRDLFTSELVDLTGKGISDLENKILRTPQDPDITFSDDPLRMLRAVRFRWKLDLDFAPELSAAIKANSGRLEIVSKERICEELTQMLSLPNAHLALQDLLDLDLLQYFAPDLCAMVGVEQGKWHSSDVWTHTLEVVRHAGSGDLTLSLAALLHDVGKPPTRSIDERGDTRFFSHEVVGAEMAEQWLLEMKFSRQTADTVSLLVKNHMRLCSMDEISPTAARRIIRDLGDHLDHWLALLDADASALKAGVRKLDMSSVRETLLAAREKTPINTLQSPLSGVEIMEFSGLAPGKKVGEAKDFLTEQVLTGELAPGDRESALGLLSVWLSNSKLAPDV